MRSKVKRVFRAKLKNFDVKKNLKYLSSFFQLFFSIVDFNSRFQPTDSLDMNLLSNVILIKIDF